MAISFNFIPNQLKTPGPIAEINIDPSARASTGQPYTTLLLGQKLAAGIAPTNTPINITSPGQANQQFGIGSQAARMVARYLANNTSVGLVVIVVDDDGGSNQADGTLTISGDATAAGSIVLTVGGVRVVTAVANGDLEAAITQNIASAVNLNPELSVTASVALSVVTLTADNGGESANGTHIFVGFNGETLPEGVSVVGETTASLTTLTGGTVNPDQTPIIAALGDTQYNVIIQPWLDATSLAAWKTELTARFDPSQSIEGIQIGYLNSTFGDLITFGGTQNDQFLSVFGANLLPHPGEEIAAALGGQISSAANIDPGLPFQTLRLAGITPCSPEFIFSQSERNLLLNGGIATVRPTSTGDVTIGRAVTTYQTLNGFDDESYLDVNTFTVLSFLRFSFLAQMAKFARFKLGADGTPGSSVMTPRAMRTEMISLFTLWLNLGLVQNADAFKVGLQVEIDLLDRNRINIVLPPELIAQLRVIAARIDFVL